jgi:FKBP-type peptidyl-prolyl cis-trans isomerase
VNLVRAISIALACGTLVALSTFGAACANPPNAPSDYAAYSQSDIVVGGGAEAVNGRVLTVQYTGWLYDGSQSDKKGLQFDTSAGTEGLTFTLGAGQVISGWDRGLVGMKVGGQRQLIIPPSLAYGGVRNGPIPQNATLVFDVALVGVE